MTLAIVNEDPFWVVVGPKPNDDATFGRRGRRIKPADNGERIIRRNCLRLA